jgi:ribosomal protein S18 acetylase RimI-like enzyme
MKKGEQVGQILYDVDPKRYKHQYNVGQVKTSDGGISHFHVEPKYRDKGIGSILIKKVERLAKKDGKKRLVLEAKAKNIRAIKLYKNHGFKIIGKKNYHWSGKTVPFIMMAKELK